MVYVIFCRSFSAIYRLSGFTNTKTVFGYCYFIVFTYGSMLGSTRTIVNLSFFYLILLFKFIEWLYYWTKILSFLFNSDNLSAEFLSTNTTITPPSNLVLINYLLPNYTFPSMLIFECKFNLSESCWANSVLSLPNIAS